MSGVGAVKAVAELDPDMILMDVHIVRSAAPRLIVISEVYPIDKVILMSSE